MADQTLAKLTQAMAAMDQRLQSLEAQHADVLRKADVLQSGSRAWRVLAQTRDRLLLGTEQGDLAQLPVHVARVLAAGRPLDLDAREAGADVELLGGRGEVVARLSRGALLGLSKALLTWQSQSHPSRPATRRSPVARTSAPQAAPGPVSGVRLDHPESHPSLTPVSPPVAPPVSPPPESTP